jgi:hypothetical protein
MKLFLKSLILCGALLTGVAYAQSEPSMSDIYAAAQAGQMDKAHAMVQQVLVTHPNSAKAFYIQAELYAKEGRYSQARENLAQAERIAPGLPFAKPQALAALRAELSQANNAVAAHPVAATAAPAQNGVSWIWLVIAAGGVMALGYFIFRPRQQIVVSEPYQPMPGGMPQTLSGPQSFGNTPYGYGGYPMQPQPGLGSRVAGGLATGLAVGAGVVAAEAIGERLFGHEAQAGTRAPNPGAGYSPIDPSINADMGGSNFGVNDTSWDGGGSGGGSDWDN